MISYNFEYYRPTSVQEAVQLYQTLKKQNKKPVYFSGGTEIITLGRVNDLITDAVIDIKEIPECNTYREEKGVLILGAALTLTKIRDVALFPFLEKVISEIADNTARNKITLGGNMCANIMYREALLPLFLTESQVVIAMENGELIEKPIGKFFDQKLKLKEGEFLVQIKTDRKAIQYPYFTTKRRRQWGVGYPLLTTSALLVEEKIKIAFSGLCSFPFRNKQMENSLNNEDFSVEERIEQCIQYIPGKVLNDVNGSAEYRIFVFKKTLQEVLQTFKKVVE